MNMPGSAGGNSSGNFHGNGLPAGMRGGNSTGGGQLPSSNPSMGMGTNPCQPGAANTIAGGSGDMCCGNGPGLNTQQMPSGMNSSYQSCNPNSTRSGTGVQGNNSMSSGGFNNEFGLHGQVILIP